MGIRRGPNIVTDGLVFAVDAANPSSYVSGSTIWKDQTVNQNNGTLTNGPTFDSGNGGSIVFDGTNDWVDCGNNTITKPSGPMTIEYWFKGKSSTVNATTSGTTGANGQRGYMLAVNKSNGWYFVIASNSTTTKVLSHTLTIDDTQWYHFAGVYNPSTYMRIFINGNQVAETTSGVPSSQYVGNSNTLKIGSRGDNTTYGVFDGNIANTQIYNRALSSTEVLHNYNALKSRFE